VFADAGLFLLIQLSWGKGFQPEAAFIIRSMYSLGTWVARLEKSNTTFSERVEDATVVYP
jgi:hypothetical protein